MPISSSKIFDPEVERKLRLLWNDEHSPIFVHPKMIRSLIEFVADHAAEKLHNKSKTELNKNNLTRLRVMYEMRQHFQEYQSFIPPGSTILDIGTGTGFTADYIKQQVPQTQITGLDVTNHVDYPHLIPRVLYDGERMPFTDKSFAISLLFYTLHHARKPESVLKEAMRVTSKTIIVIEEFEFEEASHEEQMLLEQKTLMQIGLGNEFYHNNLTQQYLEDLAKDNKLQIKKTIRLPTVSPRKLEKHLFVLTVPH